MVIFIAGILSIPEEYIDAVSARGRRLGPLPLRDRALEPQRDVHGDPAVVHRRPAHVRPHLDDDPGGPGFTTDVITSTIYKQYQAGFYGLSTAGNVVLFVVVIDPRLPADALLLKQGDPAVRRARTTGPVIAAVGTWRLSCSGRCS